jgi:hypothetical protein
MAGVEEVEDTETVAMKETEVMTGIKDMKSDDNKVRSIFCAYYSVSKKSFLLILPEMI